MAIADLYQSSEHKSNLSHFAAIVKLASVDGSINESEDSIVKGFAKKLGITDQEYIDITSGNKHYPIHTPVDAMDRKQHLLDFFKIIYSDHVLDEPEMKMLMSYAAGLGYNSEQANEIVTKSIKIFTNKFDVEEYDAILKIV